jgi:hypothetical protein
MPNIKDFIGPRPGPEHKLKLEKIIGTKPCSKCDADAEEAFWDPTQLLMTWTCSEGHASTLKVN